METHRALYGLRRKTIYIELATFRNGKFDVLGYEPIGANCVTRWRGGGGGVDWALYSGTIPGGVRMFPFGWVLA